MTDPKPPIPEAMVEIVARAICFGAQVECVGRPCEQRGKCTAAPLFHRLEAVAALTALTDSGFVILPRGK